MDVMSGQIMSCYRYATVPFCLALAQQGMFEKRVQDVVAGLIDMPG